MVDLRLIFCASLGATLCGGLAVNLAGAFRHGHPLKGRPHDLQLPPIPTPAIIITFGCNHFRLRRLMRCGGTAQSAVVSEAVRCNARAASFAVRRSKLVRSPAF